jgi:hypothetical protein
MTKLNRVTTSEEKRTIDFIPSTPADRSVGPHLVSFQVSTKEVVEKVKHLSVAGCYAYWAHITDMQSVRSILAHGDQPIAP